QFSVIQTATAVAPQTATARFYVNQTATLTATATSSPRLDILAIGLDPDNPSVLLVSVRIAGESNIVSYVVTIIDTTTNTEVNRQRLNSPLSSPVILSTTKLKPGNSYSITIQGEDSEGKIVALSSAYGFIYAHLPTSTPLK